MSLLKRLPIHYKGELHDAGLVNFPVVVKGSCGQGTGKY